MPQEDPSYYDRHKEERRLYQKEYYRQNCEAIRRKKELDALFEPSKKERLLSYQRNYYFANRERLLKARHDRYMAKKYGEPDGAES
jgi:hypothetical protein